MVLLLTGAALGFVRSETPTAFPGIFEKKIVPPFDGTPYRIIG